MEHLLRDHLRQRAPRRVRASPRRPPSATRSARASVARFIGAPSTARDRVHQERHRGDQPRRLHVGPGQPARGRRDRAHRDRAPRQPRALAHAASRSAASSCASSRWPTTTRSTSPTSTGCSTARSWCAFTAMSNVLGTLTPVRQLADAAHAAGALCWSTAPSTCPHLPTDVAGARLRLLRLHRPQDARARPASACCGPATSCSTRCRRSSAAAR